MAKLIITAAVTGGEPVLREITPYVPCSPEEIVEEIVRCWEAGESNVHFHAKEPGTGRPAPYPNPLLKQYIEMIRDRCDIIVNVTTGGREKSNAELVERIVTIVKALNIEVASPDEARSILGLRKG